jgi:CubicO group peptidase (beta-lactamase class C family)
VGAGLTDAGLEHPHAVAEAHVGDSLVPGWDGGLGTWWLVDPTCDLAVTVLTQRMSDTAQAPQVHLDIQTAAYAALG